MTINNLHKIFTILNDAKMHNKILCNSIDCLESILDILKDELGIAIKQFGLQEKFPEIKLPIKE